MTTATSITEPTDQPLVPDGDTLTAMRKALKLTQGQLASLLGLDAGTLSRWERGKPIANPSMLGFALLGIAAHDVAVADHWRRGEADEITINRSFVESLATLRTLADLADIA